MVLRPPRTSSTSLKNAILERYSEAFLLYRHMEANHIPAGYDCWDKIGVIREPIERLWSLYKYIIDRTNDPEDKHHPEWRELNKIIDLNFSNWILKNDSIFTLAHLSDCVHAKYTTSVPLPENRKSQWHTLRPDLGTIIFKFPATESLEKILDIKMKHKNGTNKDQVPVISEEAQSHIKKYFKWDLQYFEEASAFERIKNTVY